MVAVPEDIPVTRPELLTVAVAVLEDVHAPTVAGVPVALSCDVKPSQTETVPEITGRGFTVMDCEELHPLASV
jgi:hypothetical protein